MQCIITTNSYFRLSGEVLICHGFVFLYRSIIICFWFYLQIQKVLIIWTSLCLLPSIVQSIVVEASSCENWAKTYCFEVFYKYCLYNRSSALKSRHRTFYICSTHQYCLIRSYALSTCLRRVRQYCLYRRLHRYFFYSNLSTAIPQKCPWCFDWNTHVRKFEVDGIKIQQMEVCAGLISHLLQHIRGHNPEVPRRTSWKSNMSKIFGYTRKHSQQFWRGSDENKIVRILIVFYIYFTLYIQKVKGHNLREHEVIRVDIELGRDIRRHS